MSKLKDKFKIEAKKYIEEYADLNPTYGREKRRDDISLVSKKSTPINVIRVLSECLRSRINQVEGNVLWEEARVVNGSDHKANPRTFIKTVQEILVEPVDRLNFYRYQIDQINEYLDALIVSPKNINNTLLENLGLGYLLPAKGTKWPEKIIIYAQTIELIKKNIGELEPIVFRERDEEKDLNYFRILRIATGEKEGMLLGSQYIGHQERKSVFQTDVYGAALRIDHIGEGYDEEIKKLEAIKFKVNVIWDALVEWKNIKNTEELKELKVYLLECIDSLNKVQNNVKRELKRLIVSCEGFKDSRHKPNPGATRTKLNKVKKLLDDRYKEISGIAMALAYDRTLLSKLVESQEAPMKNFLKYIEEKEKCKGKMDVLDFEYIMTEEDKNELRAKLDRELKRISGLRFQPHLSFKNAYAQQIENIKKTLNNSSIVNNYELGVSKEFLKLYVLTKVFKLNNLLQRVYKEFTLHYDNVNKDDLYDYLIRMQESLSFNKLYPNILMPEYDELFEVLHKDLEELKGLVFHLNSMDDVKDFKIIFKSFIRNIPVYLKEKI